MAKEKPPTDDPIADNLKALGFSEAPTPPAIITTPEEASVAAEHARVTMIRTAAKDGWEAFAKDSPEAARRMVGENVDATFLILWPDLDTLHKNGLYSMVQSIIEDPHGDTWASIMPDNHDRKAVRELDQCFRRALGYADYRHEGE